MNGSGMAGELFFPWYFSLCPRRGRREERLKGNSKDGAWFREACQAVDGVRKGSPAHLFHDISCCSVHIPMSLLSAAPASLRDCHADRLYRCVSLREIFWIAVAANLWGWVSIDRIRSNSHAVSNISNITNDWNILKEKSQRFLAEAGAIRFLSLDDVESQFHGSPHARKPCSIRRQGDPAMQKKQLERFKN